MFIADTPPAIEEPAEAPEVQRRLTAHTLRAPLDEAEILVTAARRTVERARASDAATVLPARDIRALGEVRAAPLLRLLPSASLSESGTPGSQAQLRLRGAEANHSLLFIDGIKANDPAAGNEARFELLSTALGDSLEIVRGPQSALWGSEAIGGVVALRALDPRYRDGERARIGFEAGGPGDVFLNGAYRLDDGAGFVTAAFDHQRSRGIDSFAGEDGDDDGYRLTTARLSAARRIAPTIMLRASGFAIDGLSQFDGLDPISFRRADTSDESANRLGAARIGLRHRADGLTLSTAASFLGSRNVNRNDDGPINRTSGERLTLDAQATRYVGALDFDHYFTVSANKEVEWYRASDTAFGGLSDQSRHRDLLGLVGEWRASRDERLGFDLAIRHDIFSDFADATSFSAGGYAELLPNVQAFANYGEGIAQPSFTDLYGFFPGSFVGNDALRPESSKGGDVGLRYIGRDTRLSVAIFQQRLTDEIVTTFDSLTFLSSVANADGASTRRGVEAEASHIFGRWLTLSGNVSYLDAEEQAGDLDLRETRRPRWRGALVATGRTGAYQYGGSLAFIGSRFDDDFDTFPSRRVKLDPYALLSARVAYSLADQVTLTLRGSNLTDTRYEDVVGYRTLGRSVHVGLVLAPFG